MNALNGGLFASDFLESSVAELDEWRALNDATLDGIELSLREIFNRFPITQKPNESQTEDDLIWPVLTCLGWTSSLRQQNLTARGVDDVPDGLLFADEAAKTRANGFAEEWNAMSSGSPSSSPSAGRFRSTAAPTGRRGQPLRRRCSAICGAWTT